MWPTCPMPAASWSPWVQPPLSASTGSRSEPALVTLKSVYRHQWVANHRRLQRAGLGLEVLAEAGIETMVLKGAALAPGYYGDIAARVMLDVDILVRAERAREANDALCSAG